MVDRALSHQRLETLVDASLASAAVACADGAEWLLERGAECGEVGVHQGAGVTQCILNRRRRLAARGDDRERVLVGTGGIARVAGGFEVLALLQQRRQVSRFELQRLFY